MDKGNKFVYKINETFRIPCSSKAHIYLTTYTCKLKVFCLLSFPGIEMQLVGSIATGYSKILSGSS